MDKDTGEVPESMKANSLIATKSCIAVGTLSAGDGETSIMLTNEKFQTGGMPGLRKVFDGVLATPKRVVDVCTIALKPLLTLPVKNTETYVEIWASSETEPDKLCILTT